MRAKALAVAVVAVLVVSGVTPGLALGGTVDDGSSTVASGSLSDEANATQTTTLTLLTYNDVQTAAAKTDTFPRMATVIQQRRAAIDNPTLVLGGGDQVSPHALSPVSEWRAPVEALNRIEPAADVIGNHDLDYGLDTVDEFAAESEFPWLLSNVVNDTTGEPLAGTQRYTVVERDGVRVGVIGLVDGAIEPKTGIDLSEEGYRLQDYDEVGPQLADRLRREENVDVVVALAHVGVPEAKTLAQADDGDIDAIVVGDDEIVYEPQETSDSVILEGEARANYVGEVNLEVSESGVVDWDGRLIEVTEDIEPDEEVSSVVEEYRSEVSLDSTVTTAETALDARFATNYHRESGYGNLVAEAMREQTGADAAITNSGGIRSNAVYGPGEITGGDVFNTLPFANTITVVELTGAEIEETLESQLVTLDSGTGQQFGAEISQQVAGMSFEWVPHGDSDDKIRDLYIDGEPVDPDATYEVAVNSYIAGGGSGYPLADQPRLQETDTLLATAVVEYMEDRESVAPTVEGRMRRITTEQTVGQLDLDGEGLNVIRVTPPRTAADGSLSVGDFRATTPGTDETVEALGGYRVERTNTLWVYFSDAQLRELAESGSATDVDFYANYTDTRYEDQWVYWDTAVMGVEATVVLDDGSAAVSPALTTPDRAVAGN